MGILGCLGGFLFWSGQVAWRAFRPRIATHPAVDRVAWMRTTIGLAVSLATLVRYDALGEETFNWAFIKPYLASVGGTVLLLLILAVAAARARTGRRILLRRMARGPLLAMAVWNAVIWGYLLLLPGFDPYEWLPLLVLPLYWLSVIWMIILSWSPRFRFTATCSTPATAIRSCRPLSRLGSR